MNQKKLFHGLLVLSNLFLLTILIFNQGLLPKIKAQIPENDHFQDFQDHFNLVSAEVLPAVVEINVESLKSGQGNQPIPWEDFFDLPDQEEDTPEENRTYGLGSGIIVRKQDDGYYILTNEHVVGESPKMNVTLTDGREYEGSLVGSDGRKDLAMVFIQTDDDLTVASLGDSNVLRVGDWVLAMGSPLGYKASVSAGIVSALGRMDSPEGNINDFIQTDAAINQGNSGGALVNMHGEVVGINSWISTSTGGNIGLGFSIPINNAKKNIDDFINYGEIYYGWLGVSIGDLASYMEDEIDTQGFTGAFVYQVFSHSPAWKAGIEPGDYIISINGEEVIGRKQLTFMIGELYPGDNADFQIIRDGQLLQVSALVERRVDEDQLGQINPQAWPGINLLPFNEEIQQSLNLSDLAEGPLVDQVYPQTLFQIAGILPGDQILKINGDVILGLQDFYRSIRNNKELLELEIQRGDEVIKILIQGNQE
ncbi:MAG: Do family serine endopeptidase [Spirochaetaceae bacterium]|nr:Do family serine endopeptidase [Spirochaetaceae bacterium]